MMKLSTLTAASLLALAGASQAGEPTVLGSAQLDTVTAAGQVNFETNVLKTVDINKLVNLLVNKDVQSFVNIDDALATAEASADGVGFPNVLAETDTFAQVDSTEAGLSAAFSFSESLAAGSAESTLPPPPPPPPSPE